MPTYNFTDSFKRDHKGLKPEERDLLKDAVAKFIADLTAIEEGGQSGFRASLRVKPMKDNDGVWEMTWEYEDGRATFEYGDEVVEGKRHVLWRRVGSHAIFKDP